jgi:DNA-3-methyladenine glycosylase
LAITRAEYNGADLCATVSGLYIASDGSPEPTALATPRINVTSAPHDLWRFIIPGNPFVSGPRSINEL